MNERTLTGPEKDVLSKLLSVGSESWMQQRPTWLDTVMVAEMHDGGMGSLAFVPESDEYDRPLKVLVQGEFEDIDGTTVSIAVLVDKRERAAELDVWKVDFSPLLDWPDPERVRVKVPASGARPRS